MSRPDSVYQLKITLRGTRPPVWRRLLVDGDVTLYRLHGLLQIAMGWTDTHLHQFHAQGASFGVVDPEFRDDMLSDRRVALWQVAPMPGSRMVYEYDFGDGWEHDVRVEKILNRSGELVTPICADGRMACPPEDCGGTHGYAQILEAIADRAHPRHAEFKQWLGRPLDPAAFDLTEINRLLARRRSSKVATPRLVRTRPRGPRLEPG